ncbi:nuclear pore complex protein Nup155-like isoform X4 [Artemia franciscana]
MASIHQSFGFGTPPANRSLQGFPGSPGYQSSQSFYSQTPPGVAPYQHSLISPTDAQSSSTISHLPLARDSIDVAGRTIDKCILSDSSSAKLIDQLKITKEGCPTHSGLSPSDYPQAAQSCRMLLKQCGTMKRVPLPQELVEQFAHVETISSMGLLPQIGRAWLTIDSNIYLWNYRDGSDLAFYDGLSEAILSAGIAKPKPNVFQPQIEYLLVLATTVEIVLLGVTFSGDEIHVIPDPLFALPTDGAFILTIETSDSGRIFLGAKDGCLYEVTYTSDSGWFSRRCKKINHSRSAISFLLPSFINAAFYEDEPIMQIVIDESRRLLYTRSDKGTLVLFDLGENGSSVSRVAYMTLQNIADAAHNIVSTIDKTCFRPLAGISLIESSESPELNLVAFSTSGVRMYFTCLPFNAIIGAPLTSPVQRYSGLTLTHIRLPPGFSVSSTSQKPSNVRASYYCKGTSILSSPHADDTDSIWVASSDMFPFSQTLTEGFSVEQLDGRVCDIVLDGVRNSIVGGLKMEPPAVVVQHSRPPANFVILTSQGCHIFPKLRPVEVLRQILVESGGADSEIVRTFFTILKEEQGAAVALILACSQHAQDPQISDWATKAFLLYGGEIKTTPTNVVPTFPHSSLSGADSPLTGSGRPSFGTPIHGPPLGFSTLGTPVQSFQPPLISTPQPGQTIDNLAPISPIESFFSGKHNGIYIYLGRIIRPIWIRELISEKKIGNSLLVESSVSVDEIGFIISKLTDLQSFIERNSLITSASLPDNFNISRRNITDVPAQRRHYMDVKQAEKQSLQALDHLVKHSAEVLGLWRVICDHQLHLLKDNLPGDILSQMKMMSFRDLILGGQEVCSSLINSLINRYLADSASTDSISSRLRDVCPSLYRSDDAICSKVNELLLNARNESSRANKEQLLKEALELCKQIPTRVQLSNVCQHLSALQCFSGIVDLCLAVADKRDPQKRGLYYYQSNEPADDKAGRDSYLARIDAYRQITTYLGLLMYGIPASPQGPPTTSQTVADAQSQVENMLKLVLRSDDELCHVAVYSWLIERGLIDKLLQIRSPFLEKYLLREKDCHPEVPLKMDLLWKFYENQRNFAAASKVLAQLADTHNAQLSLNQRIEYLSRAIVCAKSGSMNVGPMSAQGDLLHELEEKMDVARLQAQILESVMQLPSHIPQVRDAISRLNSEFFNVTTLYEDFAEPFGLSECQLAIMQCAGHQDPPLIMSIWSQIFDKEIAKVGNAESSTKMAVLGAALKRLARQYASSEQYFPLEHVIKTLELYAVKFQYQEPLWLPNTLLSAGIPLLRIYKAYVKVHSARDNVWKAEGAPHHLVTVIDRITKIFAENPNSLPAPERRSMYGTLLVELPVLLSHLYGFADPQAKLLAVSLKQTQEQLLRSSLH